MQCSVWVERVLSSFSRPECTLHTTHNTLHTAHYTQHTTHDTLHTAHYPQHTAHSTLHTAPNWLHTEYINININTTHCTLYTDPCTLHTVLEWMGEGLSSLLETLYLTLNVTALTLISSAGKENRMSPNTARSPSVVSLVHQELLYITRTSHH